MRTLHDTWPSARDLAAMVVRDSHLLPEPRDVQVTFAGFGELSRRERCLTAMAQAIDRLSRSRIMQCILRRW